MSMIPLPGFLEPHFSTFDKQAQYALVHELNQCALSLQNSDVIEHLLLPDDLLDGMQLYLQHNAPECVLPLSDIAMHGSITQCPLAAMLCAKHPIHYAKRFTPFRALFALVALSHYQIQQQGSSIPTHEPADYFHSSVTIALRKVRLINRPKYTRMLSELPPSFQNFDDVMAHLSIKLQLAEEREDKTAQEILANWLQVIKTVLNKQQLSTQTHTTKKGAHSKKTQTNELVKTAPDDEGPTMTCVVPMPKHSSQHSSDLDVEESSPRNHRALLTLDNVSTPALEKQKRRSYAGDLAKRMMYTHSLVDILTPNQVSSLITQCLARHSPLDEILLLSLTHGLLIDDLAKKIVTNEEGLSYLSFKHRIPSHNITSDTEHLLRGTCIHYRMPVLRVSAQAIKLLRKPDIEEQLQHHLKENFTHPKEVKFTLHRAMRVFHAYVAQHGESEAEKELLTHVNCEKHVALYYLSTTTHALFKLQQRFIHYLNELSSGSELELGTPFENVTIGTSLYLHADKLSEWIQDTTHEINRTHLDITSAIARHNAIVSLVHLICGLGSGMRPSSNKGFGVFQDYCFISHRQYIQDKSPHTSPGQHRVSRVIRLPNLAIAVIKHYQCHLQKLIKSQRRLALPKSTIEQLQRVINSEHPFLFCLEEDGQISSTSIFEHFSTRLSLPKNWYRHFARSFLHTQDLNESAIDHHFGHNRHSGLTRGPYSQLSLSDDTNVAMHLNTLLKDLGVTLWKM